MLIKILFLFVFVVQIAWSQSIVGSKHDLSATNFYGPLGGSSTEICVFCHTPHDKSATVDGPLWNRNITDDTVFTMYNGTSGIPNNATMVCLSCHDGIAAQNEVSAVSSLDTHNIINNPGPGHATNPATPNCNACHSTPGTYPGQEWRIGPDLTDDHPVSVLYRSDLPSEFLSVPINGVRLYNNMVECSSCHDVHNNQYGMFLRTMNNGSALCYSCHIK